MMKWAHDKHEPAFNGDFMKLIVKGGDFKLCIWIFTQKIIFTFKIMGTFCHPGTRIVEMWRPMWRVDD